MLIYSKGPGDATGAGEGVRVSKQKEFVPGKILQLDIIAVTCLCWSACFKVVECCISQMGSIVR